MLIKPIFGMIYFWCAKSYHVKPNTFCYTSLYVKNTESIPNHIISTRSDPVVSWIGLIQKVTVIGIYGRYSITIVDGVYKQTCNWGAHLERWLKTMFYFPVLNRPFGESNGNVFFLIICLWSPQANPRLLVTILHSCLVSTTPTCHLPPTFTGNSATAADELSPSQQSGGAANDQPSPIEVTEHATRVSNTQLIDAYSEKPCWGW